MQQSSEQPAIPELGDILTAVRDEVGDASFGEVERVTIEQATPWHYMVRVYPPRSDEYEALQIRLESRSDQREPSDAVSPTLRGGE